MGISADLARAADCVRLAQPDAARGNTAAVPDRADGASTVPGAALPTSRGQLPAEPVWRADAGDRRCFLRTCERWIRNERIVRTAWNPEPRRRQMRRRSFTGPLLLLLIGAFFLWRNLHPEAPLFDMAAQYWPFVLIAWGLLRLIEVVALRHRGPTFTGGEVVLVVFICI